MPHPEYAAVRAKVDAFTSAVETRRRSDLACGPGCAACCHVELEVCDVEAEAIREAVAALDSETRDRLDARARRRSPGDPCVMLDRDRCVIYEARPLVCRTQGHALRYPRGTIPEAAVRASAPDSDVTCCPLNYRERAPHPEDVLDAERVDVLLALVNRRASDRPLSRTSLVALAKR